MIPFPKIHIATSVVNRILNIADGIEQQAPPLPMPQIAEPSVQGAVIDAETAAGPPPNVPPLNESPDAGALLSGRPALDTILNPGGNQ